MATPEIRGAHRVRARPGKDDKMTGLSTEKMSLPHLSQVGSKQMLRMAISFIAALLTLMVPLNAGRHAAASEGPLNLDVKELLKKVDDVRRPGTDFSVEVAIHTNSGGGGRLSKYEVMVNGDRDTLVKTVYPPNDKGQAMLMKGRDFWVYLPTVDQPVRLSLSQRLIGQVSNGDIARMNFSGDYEGTLLRTEEAEGKKIAVLALTATADWVTYGKAILWVSLPDAHPIRAEFYTASDILLKTCEFAKYEKLAGTVRPSQLIFVDATKKEERSVLTYSNMRAKKIPGKYFTKEYMKKLD